MLYASRFLRLDKNTMAGPDVRLVKTILKDLGFLHGRVNDIYSTNTARAVINWQEKIGVYADGIVGPDAWMRLLKMGSPAVQETAVEAERYPNITIDLHSRRLHFHTDPTHRKVYPVAIGKPSTPSPPGHWVIVQKTVNPGGPFGVRWMRLSVPWGGYGIHGTNNPRSIGRAASHGCIRMYNKDVIAVYDQTPLGTPVHIIGPANTGRILQIGSRGEDVAKVQQSLRRLGYYKAQSDGIYGPNTAQAVKAFQQEMGLTVDGEVGQETYVQLQKMLDIAQNDIDP